MNFTMLTIKPDGAGKYNIFAVFSDEDGNVHNKKLFAVTKAQVAAKLMKVLGTSVTVTVNETTTP